MGDEGTRVEGAVRSLFLLHDAVAEAESLVEHVRQHPAVRRAEVSGDLRRRLEVVDRIDLVVAGVEAEVRDHVARRPLEIAARITAVSAASFALALLRTTGPEAHVRRLAALATSRGLPDASVQKIDLGVTDPAYLAVNWNASCRQCDLSGLRIFLLSGDANVVERNVVRDALVAGVLLIGDGNTVRRNRAEGAALFGVSVIGDAHA